MAERVPITTVIGSLTPWVDVDWTVLPAGFIGNVTSLFVAVTDAPSGGTVAVRFGNATAGGGDGIAATIADGTKVQTATGTVPFTGTETGYFRITAESGAAYNLQGWFEVDASLPTGSTLTSLARVKRELQITAATHDTILNEIIAGVTKAFQGETNQTLLQSAVTEKLDGSGWTDTLILSQIPVQTSPALVLTLNGTTVATTEYEIDTDSGLIVRVEDGTASVWTAGRRNYQAAYTAGYSTVPADLVEAATAQAVHQFNQSVPGGSRRGVQSVSRDAGGATTYVEEDLLPNVRRTLARYQRWA